jgi:hypothetical protein
MKKKELLTLSAVIAGAWVFSYLIKSVNPTIGFPAMLILLIVIFLYYSLDAFKESLKHDNKDSFKLTDKNSSIGLALVAVLLYFVFYWGVSSFMRKVSIGYRIDPESWEMLVVISAAVPAIGFYKIMNFLRKKNDNG